MVYHRITITGSHSKWLFSFALLSPATRKRVHVLFQANLILCVIIFQLVLDVFLDHFRIFSYGIYIVPSAPEISASIPIFQIRMSIKDHQCTFTLERSYKLCYTHIRRDTHQHVDVIGACLCLYNLYFHFIAKLAQYLTDISLQFPIYNFASVFGCKHYVVLTPIARMCGVFHLILHFV